MWIIYISIMWIINMLIKPKKTLKYHLLFKIRINLLHINIVFCEKYIIKKKTEK